MEFIKDLFGLILNWPMGTILASLIFVAIILLLGIILANCFFAIDSLFLPKNQSIGKVVSKHFTPSYDKSFVMYSPGINMSMSQTISYPDDWLVRVEVCGCQDTISIKEEEYCLLEKGDSVVAEYVRGRISDNIYLKKISHIK